LRLFSKGCEALRAGIDGDVYSSMWHLSSGSLQLFTPIHLSSLLISWQCLARVIRLLSGRISYSWCGNCSRSNNRVDCPLGKKHSQVIWHEYYPHISLPVIRHSWYSFFICTLDFGCSLSLFCHESLIVTEPSNIPIWLLTRHVWGSKSVHLSSNW
jgi:hypothetical protein